MASFRILTGDPGSANFALSVCEVSGAHIKVLGTKMMVSPVSDLSVNCIDDVAVPFTKEMRVLFKEFKPDYTCFERFQFRGVGTVAIEQISFMLGILAHLSRINGAQQRLITASTWKNPFNRNNVSGAKLDELYKELNLTSKKSEKTIHEFDASLIGIYTWYTQCIMPERKDIKPFTKYDPYFHYDSLMSSAKL